MQNIRLEKEIQESKNEDWLVFRETYNIKIFMEIELYEPLQKICENNELAPILKMEFNRYYPFQPPEVCFNSHNLKDIYNFSILDNYIEIFDDKCFCCSTIICSHNWGPMKNIKDIINEFKQFTQLKYRLVERLYCKKVQMKYLPQIPIKYFSIHNYL